MTLKYNSLDVYFHMTNHYKKLQSVKSVVDTSSPIGYCERQSRPPSRAEQRRETFQNDGLKIRYDKFKNSSNSPLNKKCETPRSNFARSASISARPQTRRRLADMPTTQACPQRAKSSGPFVKEKSNIPKLRLSRSNRSSRFNSPANSSTPRSSNQKNDIRKEVLKESEAPIPAPRRTKRRRNAFKNWIIEHDYMEFMLRITEDIIQNNLYTGEEILQVLNSHIDTNVERLSVPKMLQQIRILCRELNVPFDKILIGNSKIETEFMEPLESIQKSLICTCNSVTSNNNNHDFGDCECTTKRSTPLQCVIHNGKYEIDDLLKINQDFSPPQNIIETYYFKNENDSANSEQTTSINTNESNDQERFINSPALSCVPELSQTSTFSEVATIRNNQPQTSQPSQTICTSPKKSHTHPCNCNKSNQWQLHSHTKFTKSSNGDENVQLQNNKTTVDNSVNSISKQVAENIFYIGCPCSNLTEPSSILTGPLDFVLCCTNVIPHVDNVHQLGKISEDVTNEPFGLKKTDKTRTNQNELINALNDIKMYPLPVTQKHNFYNKKENFQDQDEEFVMSLGTAYMPKSVSRSRSGSFYENVCVVNPDATDKCQLILLKNQQKQYDAMATESNESCEVSELNSSYIIETPRVITKNVPLGNSVPVSTQRGHENNCSDQCCAQISSAGTMTAVQDKNNKSNINKTFKTTTTGAMTSNNTNKKIYLIVPDDVKHDQIFVVRKSQFQQLDANSRTSDESELQIIKDSQSTSPVSSIYSCMGNLQDATSDQASIISKPAHKIKKTYNLKNTAELQGTGEGTSHINIATSSNIINTSNTPSKSSLKNYQPNNSSFSGNIFLSTTAVNPDTETYSPNDYNSKTLSKLNDYDLTPQRDNNSTSNKRTISFSSDLEIATEPMESNKDRLLLGNEYDISKVSSYANYGKGMPDSIKQFYPNTASQTGPSDPISESKSMSETSVISYDLDPTSNNSDYSLDNRLRVGSKSQSLVVSSKNQNEEDSTNIIPVLKQITNLQLDLLLDVEVNSEEESLKQTYTPNSSKIMLNDLNNDKVSHISSSTLIFDELLISYKQSQKGLKDQTKSVLSNQFPKSEEMIVQNVDHDKISIMKSGKEVTLASALKSSLQRVSKESSAVTDSRLLLLLNKDERNDSNISTIRENDYQGELNELIEKSKTNSNIDDSFNSQSRLKVVEPAPQAQQNGYNEDKDGDNYANTQKQMKIKTSFSKSSRINKPDLNIVENDRPVNGEFEKSSLKTLENKPSTQSSQRRVLIKEILIDRKESFVPYSSSRHDSAAITMPIIQIEESDVTLTTANNKRNSSNDSTQTSCCGLKFNKAKTRRDVIDVDKSLQTIPNISTIPDDQLFEVEMRRNTAAGYGAERKSLRFDYSMMSELSDVGCADGEKRMNVKSPKSADAESTKSRKSETSSLVIDIFKPARDDSSESFMMDSSYLKEKNIENQETSN